MRRTRRLGEGLFAVLLCTLGSWCVGCSVDEPLGDLAREAMQVMPRDLGPPKRVFAKRFVAPIRAEPNPEGARLGYLRAGALLRSTTTEPLSHDGCEGGWYELDSGGYACSGRDILVFSGDRLPELRARQPDLDAVMPYEYVTVRRRTPLYKRIPRADEVYVPPPKSEDDEATPEERVTTETVDHPLVVRILQPGFYVSLDRRFVRDDDAYWRTQQNGFIAEDAIRRKPWSEHRGQVLGRDGWTLPVAATRAETTTVYRVTERGKLRTTRERLPRRSWLRVRARRLVDGQSFIVVGQDRLVRDRDVLVIDASAPPEGVGEGERWIEIDLAKQVLVAYAWRQPRYVTLVSTGRTRTPSPELDYRTPRGLHRIRGKHLTSTMDNDEPGEPPYSLEDVPYVMYFRGAYAFHSAFWHDRFGRPRSHGCINLAPHDAKWLYHWAGPDLPPTWHGGSATEENPGTWVWVHGETPGAGRR